MELGRNRMLLSGPVLSRWLGASTGAPRVPAWVTPLLVLQEQAPFILLYMADVGLKCLEDN